MSQITIYTDGGCSPNPGPGAWAALIRAEINGQTVERELSGAVAETNNQRMELTAVAEALESLKRPCTVTLISDSNYVVRGMTEWVHNWIANGWQTSKKRPVKHADLWRRIVAQAERHTVTFEWVKAHAGDQHNERVDALVRQAREKAAQPEPERPYRLLIAGSRRTSTNMKAYAGRLVTRAAELGWEIVVSDDPDGIACAVIEAARQQGYSRVIVVGTGDTPRNGGHGRYVQIGSDAADRDRQMMRASDRGLFIWDGDDASIRARYHAMKAAGKVAHLADFSATFA